MTSRIRTCYKQKTVLDVLAFKPVNSQLSLLKLNSFHEQLEEFQQCRRILLQCCNECSAFNFVLFWFICFQIHYVTSYISSNIEVQVQFVLEGARF